MLNLCSFGSRNIEACAVYIRLVSKYSRALALAKLTQVDYSRRHRPEDETDAEKQ